MWAGIMFQDITTLLLDPKAFKDTVDLFIERYKGKNISAVAGEVISEEYVLEYGRDCLEMHVGAVEKGERALVVDDLIATGGTLRAAMNLLGRCNYYNIGSVRICIAHGQQGRERLQEKPLYVLVEYH
ncbi:Adenine phosphoribosyltransferase 4 [Linum perenne]